LAGLDHDALHVINGDIAASTFRHAIADDRRIIVHRDVLSCGPTPAFLDVEDWKRQRFAFWKTVVAHDPDFELRTSRSDLLENVPRIVEARRVYAWAASGNTDQLMVCFLFELLERLGADPGKLELIEFSRESPGGRRIMALGELDLAEMRQHPPPRSLQVEEWMAFRQAWRAVSSPDPLKLQGFADQRLPASDWLCEAVRLMLRRYPDRVHGLPHWDHQLLRNVRRHGPGAARVIGHTLGENLRDGDLTGDLYLYWRLLRMASAALPRPLLTVSGDVRTMQGASVELTEFGALVAVGAASAGPENPVDDWAGGVHLSSAEGNVWFNDGGRLVRG
jgi:hypothetical protein